MRICVLIVNQFQFLKRCSGFGRGISPANPTSPVRRPNSPDHPNPALPITETPSPAMARIGWALRTLLLADGSSCLKDRKVNARNIFAVNHHRHSDQSLSTGFRQIDSQMCTWHRARRLADEPLRHRPYSNASGRHVASDSRGRCS